jgi:hypothetical protein
MNALPPLIPPSVTYQNISTSILKFQELYNKDIIIKSGTISGLAQPINLSDAANIEYVNDTLNFSDVNSVSLINDSRDITYTAQQLVGSIIQRDPNGSTRFDSFSSVADILNALGTYSSIGTSFQIIISNTAPATTSNLVVIDYKDLNVIESSSNIVVKPESSAILYCIVVGSSSSSSSSGIDAYYYNTIGKNMANAYNIINNGLSLNTPLRSYQLITKIPIVYNYNIFSNDIPAIPNVLFNILGDYSVDTSNTFDIVGNLPSSDAILTSLGLDANSVTDGASFNFTVKLTAFISHLPSLYSYTINASDVQLDPNSIFVLEFSELAWKYASYSIVYESGVFTAYCTAYYDVMTQ